MPHFTRRSIVLSICSAVTLALLAPLSVSRSFAAQAFDFTAFEAAQSAGKPILVDVTAPWCPTCRVQKPILERFSAEMPKFVIFEVDFDTRKDVLRHFRVQSQSTLIVFSGSREVGRSTGDTNPESIKGLLTKGL